MRSFAVVSGIVLVAIAVTLLVLRADKAQAPGSACPTDTKTCADGSVVSRSGPFCDFLACPKTVATSTAGIPSILPYDSGIEGAVTLGPTCPVQRMPPDPACADKPYATGITVRRTATGPVFVTGSSDASGAFKISLPPGTYVVSAAGGSMLPRCASVDVTVGARGYAQANISCDSGIR